MPEQLPGPISEIKATRGNEDGSTTYIWEGGREVTLQPDARPDSLPQRIESTLLARQIGNRQTWSYPDPITGSKEEYASEDAAKRGIAARGKELEGTPTQYLVNPESNKIEAVYANSYESKKRIEEGWRAPTQAEVEGQLFTKAEPVAGKTEAPRQSWSVKLSDGSDIDLTGLGVRSEEEAKLLVESDDFKRSLPKGVYLAGTKWTVTVPSSGNVMEFDTPEAAETFASGLAGIGEVTTLVTLPNGNQLTFKTKQDADEFVAKYKATYGAEQVAATVDAVADSEVETEPTQLLDSGERIHARAYLNLSEGDRNLLNEVGVSEFNRLSQESAQVLSRERDIVLEEQEAERGAKQSVLDELAKQGFSTEVAGVGAEPPITEYDLVGALDAGFDKNRLSVAFGDEQVAAAADMVTVAQEQRAILSELRSLGYAGSPTPTIQGKEVVNLTAALAAGYDKNKLRRLVGEAKVNEASAMTANATPSVERRWVNVRTGDTISEDEHAALGYSAKRDEYRLEQNYVKAQSEAAVRAAGLTLSAFAGSPTKEQIDDLAASPGWNLLSPTTRDVLLRISNMGDMWLPRAKSNVLKEPVEFSKETALIVSQLMVPGVLILTEKDRMSPTDIGINAVLDAMYVLPVIGATARRASSTLARRSALSREADALKRIEARATDNMAKVMRGYGADAESAFRKVAKAQTSYIDALVRLEEASVKSAARLTRLNKELEVAKSRQYLRGEVGINDISRLEKELDTLQSGALKPELKSAEVAADKLQKAATEYVKATQGKVRFDSPRAKESLNDFPKLIVKQTQDSVSRLIPRSVEVSKLDKAMELAKAKLVATQRAAAEAQARLDTTLANNAVDSEAAKLARSRARDADSKVANAVWDVANAESALARTRSTTLANTYWDVVRTRAERTELERRLQAAVRSEGRGVAAEPPSSEIRDRINRLSAREHRMENDLRKGINNLEVEWGAGGRVGRGGAAVSSPITPEITRTTALDSELRRTGAAPRIKGSVGGRGGSGASPISRSASDILGDRTKNYTTADAVGGVTRLTMLPIQVSGTGRPGEAQVIDIRKIAQESGSVSIRSDVKQSIEQQSRTAVDNAVRVDVSADLKARLSDMVSTTIINALKADVDKLTKPQIAEMVRVDLESRLRVDLDPATRVQITPDTKRLIEPAVKIIIDEGKGERDRGKRPKPRFPIELGGGGEGGRVPVPLGSLAWKQGYTWKYLPPPWNASRPISLRRGEVPQGAKLGGDTPAATIQIVGRTRAKVPKTVNVDLGVVDIFVLDYGKRIEFAGSGEDTNVGESLDSNTTGLTIDDAFDLPYRAVTVTKAGRKRPAYKRRTKERASLVALGGRR